MAMMRKSKLVTALDAVQRAFEQQEEEILTALELIDVISRSGTRIPTDKMLTLAADLKAARHPLSTMIPLWPDGDDDEEDRLWALEAQLKLKKYLRECLGLPSDARKDRKAQGQ